MAARPPGVVWWGTGIVAALAPLLAAASVPASGPARPAGPIAWPGTIAFAQRGARVVTVRGRSRPDPVAEGTDPAWSPDGRQLAFDAERGGNTDIYVAAADGRNLRRLTFGVGSEAAPEWSPDGRLIAFQSSTGRCCTIRVVPASGGPDRQLIESGRFDGQPSWSPDGRRVAFERCDGHLCRLMVARVHPDRLEPAAPVQLVPDLPGDQMLPCWSPDGRRIAFVGRASGNLDVYTVYADGSHPVAVTHSVADELSPTWSPDGGWIAFQSRTGAGGDRIYAMRVDGSAVLRIAQGGTPAWRPTTR